MNLIIDTDMGIDDAIAMLICLAHPETNITAITTVTGNVPLSQATHNIGVVLNVAQAPPIPIYRGCGKPLLQYKPENAVDIHGEDGLGGAGANIPSRPIEAEHAALAMTRLARENPGQLTLLTLGPLTNVALALRLDPTFFNNIDRLVMMAGAVDGRGNTSAPAEFNVWADPESAKIVFDACRDVPGGVWLLPWETSINEAISFETWDKITKGSSAAAQFTRQMTRHIEKVMEIFQADASFWPDPLAAAITLNPHAIAKQEHRFVEVDIGAGPARGQTIVDYRIYNDTVPNMTIVRGVDMSQFERMLTMAVQ